MVEQGKKPLPVSVILWGMVAILVIAGLLLPPVSLGKRLVGSDYVRLDADSSQADHPDGLTLAVDAALLSDRLEVKLDSIPQLDVSSGVVAEEWQAAAAALPADLVLKSPLYGIAFKDDTSPPVQLEIVIPNGAEPYALLDLYAWDGAEWNWIPGQLDVETDKIHVSLDHAPEAVVVVQAGPKAPAVELILGEGASLPFKLSGMVTGVHPGGLILGPGGSVMGDIAHLGGGASAYQQIPRVASSDPVMVQALIADSNAVASHIASLVNVLSGGSYAGLLLDYPGVPAPQQDAFTNLIAGLAAELHAAGLELQVTVPTPTQTVSGEWDTAGYDWVALLNTAQADRLVLSLPLDPYSYSEYGLAESILTWAVARVNRSQLLLGINAAGTQLANGEYSSVDPADALDAMSTLLSRADGGDSDLLPGQEVVVGFPAKTLTFDPDAETYRVSYDVEGQEINIWLSSAAVLDQKLALVNAFRLGGTLIKGVSEAQVDDELLPALDTFLTEAAAPVAQSASLAWVVQDESGSALVQQPGDVMIPQYAWQAVETPGAYSIGGSFSIGSHVADLGAVQVAVVVEPSPTPSPEPTGTPEPTATPLPTEAASSGDSSGAVSSDADAVIAGAVVNVREGPDTAFRQITSLNAGTALEVLAVNPAKTWIKISATDGTEGWVYAQLCTIKIGLDGLPEEDVPTPTPAPTAEGSTAPPIAAPPPVSSGGFELGGHIRGWNYLSQMASAGMNWVKVQVHYGQDAAGLVSMAHSNGYKIQLSALGSRDMVNQANFHSDYGAWVAGMAATGADAIEVWNEPNIDHEWPLGQISPTAYTQLLCSAYSAIKNANGGTAVISAAPAPTGYFGGCSGDGCDDLPWLQGMVNAGAASCMDYIGAHHNAGATSPSASSGHPADGGGGHHSWYFLPQTQLYYNVFGGSRKLFYTEMGYASQEGVPTFSDWFSWARGITNAQQAAWLAEAASLSSSTGMVRCLIVWNIDFSRYGDDPQDGYAIIRPDGSCPACSTLGAVMGR